MQIQIDSREKSRAIKKIIKEFDTQKINHFVSKLYVGDYMSFDNPHLIIDRKQNLSEIYQNVCHQHERFVRELEKAIIADIKIIVLIEHGNDITCLSDVKKWYNPQLDKSPYAWSGERLYKTLYTMANKYNIEFLFCNKNQTGKKIIEILGDENGVQRNY